MKKFKRFTARTMLVTTGSFLLVSLLFIIVPFISLSNKPYTEICAEAAQAYGINPDEYQVQIKETVKNSDGKTVQGLYNGYEIIDGKQVHKIQIRKQSFRVMVVATIFHEFAHAAQYKYKLDTGKYSLEQHAEILSFTVMQKSGYWWDSLHLLASHTFYAKPSDYRAPSELWRVTFTGANLTGFALIK